MGPSLLGGSWNPLVQGILSGQFCPPGDTGELLEICGHYDSGAAGIAWVGSWVLLHTP